MDVAMNAPKNPGRPLAGKSGFSNAYIASRLDELARLLAIQGASPYRVKAYHHAAKFVRELAQPVMQLMAEVEDGTQRHVKGIGPSLTRAIKELAETGSYSYYQRVRSISAPEALLAEVPTIGPQMARTICKLLRLHSLLDLERAAADGSLERVPGVGQKRGEAVRDYLLARQRQGQLRTTHPPANADQPTVAELLSVDAEYRQLAQVEQPPLAHDALFPRRIQRGGRRYLLHFSQSWLAKEAGKTRDWVVIEFDAPGAKQLFTVITADYGAMKGHRVVRGRESECHQLYFGRSHRHQIRAH